MFLEKFLGRYDICFLLDVSKSVEGTCLRSSVLAILAIAAALDNCEIETFTVMTFSDQVTLIKSFAEEWGEACVCRLLTAATDTRPGSLDADGIHIAVDYFLASESANQKQMFVFTDGYGSCGSRLQKEQQRAALAGIDVIGVGLGIEQTAVDKAYYSSVTAATVAHLPEALRGLFLVQPTSDTPDWYEQQATSDSLIVADVQKEWNQHSSRKIYEGLADRISDELHVSHKVYVESTGGFSSQMKMDVCYVIDGTGSMSSYISAAKNWIVEITQDICKNLQQSGRSGDIRVACVIYRSSCCRDESYNEPDIFEFDKAENLGPRIQKVHTSGGCGAAADVIGGLKWALNLSRWRSDAVQYIIEMGDEAPHGDYWNISNSKHDRTKIQMQNDQKVIQSIRDRNIKLIFSTVVSGIRDRLRNGLQENYNCASKGLKLQELDFCKSGISSPGAEFKKIILKSVLSEIL